MHKGHTAGKAPLLAHTVSVHALAAAENWCSGYSFWKLSQPQRVPGQPGLYSEILSQGIKKQKEMGEVLYLEHNLHTVYYKIFFVRDALWITQEHQLKTYLDLVCLYPCLWAAGKLKQCEAVGEERGKTLICEVLKISPFWRTVGLKRWFGE